MQSRRAKKARKWVLKQAAYVKTIVLRYFLENVFFSDYCLSGRKPLMSSCCKSGWTSVHWARFKVWWDIKSLIGQLNSLVAGWLVVTYVGYTILIHQTRRCLVARWLIVMSDLLHSRAKEADLVYWKGSLITGNVPQNQSSIKNQLQI